MPLTQIIRFRTSSDLKRRAARIARADKIGGKSKTISDLGRESFYNFVVLREKELGLAKAA